MNPSRAERGSVAGPRWLMVAVVLLLLLVMAVSFVGIPWDRALPASECGGAPCEVPVTGEGSIGRALFGPFVIVVIVSALVLAAAMIGGVYLAKEDVAGEFREEDRP